MVLHALQDHFGHLTSEAMEWAAARLELQRSTSTNWSPFYPMFRQKPVGVPVQGLPHAELRLGGSHALHRTSANGWGSTRMRTGRRQRRTAGSPSSSSSASPAAARPVMMLNDDLHEGVTREGRTHCCGVRRAPPGERSRLVKAPPDRLRQRTSASPWDAQLQADRLRATNRLGAPPPGRRPELRSRRAGPEAGAPFMRSQPGGFRVRKPWCWQGGRWLRAWI